MSLFPPQGAKFDHQPMPIDLMRFEVLSRTIKTNEGRPIAPSPWSCDYRDGIHNEQNDLRRCVHEFEGGLLRVESCMGNVHLCTVNLARLVHGGSHGGVIDSQKTVEHAFRELTRLLDEISVRDNPNRPDRFKFIYLELGWNILHNYKDLERRLLNAKHPWVRRTVNVIPGEGLTFPGKEFGLKIYDKSRLLKHCREIAGDVPNVTRIEVVIRGKKLKTVMGGGEFRLPPTFEECWAWFLSALYRMQFKPLKEPATRKSNNPFAELCARALNDGYLPLGMNPVDFVLRDASKSTRRRFKRSVAEIQLSLSPWSWRDFFAPSNPTPVMLLPDSMLIKRPQSLPHRGHGAQGPSLN